MCIWQKKYNGYDTDCGHSITVILRNAKYCPFCGDEIEKHRNVYQNQYYANNREKIKAQMARNYREKKGIKNVTA